MREFRKMSKKSGGSTENRLDGRESDLREAYKKTAAIVYSRTKAWAIVVMVETDLRIALRSRS